MHRVGVEAGAGKKPGDERVRVPHLACPELVTSPDRRGRGGDELEDALREERVVRQPPRALDRLVDIRDHAVTPAPVLVPEEP
jgi:hypothetical protein